MERVKKAFSEPERMNMADSHASFLNNKRIVERFVDADIAFINASCSPLKFFNIEKYFCILESIFIATNKVLDKQYFDMIVGEHDQTKKLTKEGLIKKYKDLYMKMLGDKKFITTNNCMLLLDYCRKMHYVLTNGLQELQFFFRVSKVREKGLNNLDFLNDNALGSKIKEEDFMLERLEENEEED